MSTIDDSQKDDFELDIDSAIDTLFNPSRSIEIDPQTGEVKETSASEEIPLSLSLEKDADSAGSEISFDQEEVKNSPTEQIIEELDQSFMALDWEISATNISSFQTLLKKFRTLLKLDGQSPAGQIAVLMDQVLEAMAETPEELPATAVKTIHKGLVVLRESASSDQESLAAVASLAKKTIIDLKGIIPASKKAAETEPAEEEITINFDTEEGPSKPDSLSAGEEELSLPEEMLLKIPDEPLPLELSNTINLHLTILSQCINRILPLEDLFGENPRYEKLLNRHREIRELLEEEKDIMTTALMANHKRSGKSPGTNIPADLYQAITKHISALHKPKAQLQSLEKAFAEKKGYEKLSAIERSLHSQLKGQLQSLSFLLKGKSALPGTQQRVVPAEVGGLVTEHLQVLSACIKNILPMENLFGRTKGYEKLHTLQKRIRVQLSEQEDLLKKALAGSDTPPLPQEEGAKKSPWPVLRVGYWEGEKVGFVPEQIAAETQTSKCCLRKLQESGDAGFPLKNLRKWPWSKIKPILQNELSKMDEKQLASMNVPVLNNPAPFKKSRIRSGNETLILLFHNNSAATAALDGPTEKLIVKSNYKWIPALAPANKTLIGYLETDEGVIPVLSPQ